jgi:diguanylate cyclase (GGDEF)-like protein
MPSLTTSNERFQHALNGATDVLAAAEVLCRFIKEIGLSDQPRCLWHLSSLHNQALGHQSFPVMGVHQMAALERHADDNTEKWLDQPVFLARHKRSYFILHIPEPAADSEKRKSFDDVLIFLKPVFRYLLANDQVEQQKIQLKKSDKLQQALFDISNLAYTELDSGVLFRKLHAIIAGLVYAENFFIVRFNETTCSLNFLYYADSLDKEPVDPEVEWTQEQMANSLTLAMMRSKKPGWGSSHQLIDKYGLNYQDSLGPDSQDWLGLPLMDGSKVVGGLVVQSYRADTRYSQSDLNLLTFVAEHIRQTLTRREHTEELEQRVMERTAKLSQEIFERQRSEEIQSALFNITRLASQTDSLEQFYPAMHDIVGRLLDAKNLYIAFVDKERDMLLFPYRVDESGDNYDARPIANGLTEWVLKQKVPMLLRDQDILKLKAEGKAEFKGSLPKCWLGVPMISEGKVIGVMTLQSYIDTHAYSAKEQDLLVFVSTHIAQALQKIESSNQLKRAYAEMETNVRKRTEELELSNLALREQISRREQAEQKLKYDAQHDQLTGLANRNQLYDRLKQSLSAYQAKPSRLFAVFFIDLDRFKIINDSMGHWIGDELLKTVGERILSCVRKPDLVARLGGDEFAVILNSIRNAQEARLIAERMLKAFHEPIHIQGKELFISPSIGIAISHERHHDPDEILRDSDIALYRSKELGRNRYTFFDDALHQSALNTLIVEGDLRRGLTRIELFPHYQPIFGLDDGKIQGYEALMRWRHPQRGILLPVDFLGVARETGLIEQMDWVMYEQVCRDLPVLLGTSAYVSINVSPRHLGNEHFANRLLALMSEYGVAPENMVIEVTEDALIEHPEIGLRLLTQLKQAGIRISLDDFGTGYSSFSYLHRYPLDCLKIDRSFIATLVRTSDDRAQHLVKAIHMLGQSLGLDVIAEGIETIEQRDRLLEIGITSGQGNFFAIAAGIEMLGNRIKQASA